MSNSIKPTASRQFISATPDFLEDDTSGWKSDQPSFNIENVQLQFDLRNGLQNLLVSNNFMYVLSSNIVFRIDLDNPSIPTKIMVPMLNDGLKVTNWWLHPNGKFLIVQVNNNQYFHLHSQYLKFKILPRLKGLNIEHICFGDKHSHQSTGDFLLSSKDGNIYVASIKFHEPGVQDKKRDDKYVKQLHRLDGTIHGLLFSNNSTQIQIFVDDEILVWDCFEPVMAELTRVFRQPPKKLPITLLNEQPIFFIRQLNFYLVDPLTGDIYSNDEEIQMSPTDKMNLGKFGLFGGRNSFIVTSHHIICLSQSRDSLIIFSKLVLQSPIVIPLGPHIEAREQVFGLVSDVLGNTHWIFTSDGIYEILISNESISVWYNYYRVGNYEQALRLLEASNVPSSSLKKNMVLVKQGYDLLQKGDFGLQPLSHSHEAYNLQLEGVRQLARLKEPFEKVCLMLFGLQESNFDISLVANKLLLEYLKVKFSLSKDSNNRTRIVVLSSWIVQLLLRVIQTLESRLRIDDVDNFASYTENYDTEKDALKKSLDEFNSSLDEFLKANYKLVDSITIYEILRGMGFPLKLLSFAELLEEYDFILNYYIEREQWSNALKALSKLFVKNKERALEAMQRTSTVLLINYASGTIEAWLRFPEVYYEALLPAILTYNRNGEYAPFNQNPTMQFFLRLIFEKGIQSQVMNDYYLALLVTYPPQDDEDEINTALIKTIEYLKKEKLNQFRKGKQYDSEYLLRLCLKHNKVDAAIFILVKDMHLFDTALKLAMDQNLVSAAEFVLQLFNEYVSNDNKPGSGEHVTTGQEEESQFTNHIKLEDTNFASRKRLWMIYAKYLITSVCNGVHFNTLENKNELLIDNSQLKKIKSNNEEILANGIGERGSADTDTKLKSQELNKVLNYILHLNREDETISILTLKDLLPLLPEDVLITSFKEEIVDSLDNYNNRINQLSLEMQESAEIADKLKGQILNSEAREKSGSLFTIIEPGEPCKLCERLLIDKNFLAFRNCHHCFHKDCAIRYYLKLRGDYRFKKIFQNFKINSSVTDERELDDILLSNCLLCNVSSINSVDEYLVDFENQAEEKKDWDL